ncbi:MAG: TOBE-like domain-containing protein [Deltaproteobacteria bacterium]|nr:TOBE-like domain-containing protein [Deltaproteobacteria bacterium]
MSIQAYNVYKTFGSYKALKGVNLDIPEGKLVSLLGPSGSGKTTLLRILAGLEFPDENKNTQIIFHGEDVTYIPAGKRRIGFVFQHYALFRNMTVAENIAFGLSCKPKRERPSSEEIRYKVNQLIELVQLEGLNNRYPSELSGGQQQRVALARALAVNPRVLLLDEPFGALDAKVRKELRRWLRMFQEDIKITTVFVTHDQEEALELADVVIILNKGEIVQIGSPQEVYDSPASPFVIEFLGNVNKLKGGLNNIPNVIRNTGILYVRPYDVDIQLQVESETDYVLPAIVRHIFSAGNYGRVALESLPQREPFEAEISRNRLRDLDLKPGLKVFVVFRHVRLFENDSVYREIKI